MPEGTHLLSPGAVIADTYEVERQLGQGGMGEVWLAKHRRLAGKQVAIKVLHVDRALPEEALARFQREAEIAARLEHPHIVQVSDFNTLPTGQPYLVMELLKGQSLAARVRGKALMLEQVLGIMRQVGAALQAAHRAGVVHRDLKPENIFLVPTALGDTVKVLDFGISKLSGSSTVQTTDSVLIGTPLYMSPEQALGNNKDVTPQSDLFSLGSICYELLTGRAPFLADSVAKIVFRIAYEKHAPLSSLRDDLPPSVVAAVEHALEKDRDKRTPNIEAFVLELTGQPLAEVQAEHDETSGVYQPGMSVTPSMASGQTRSRATPLPPSSPAASLDPAPPRTISGRVFILSLLAGVMVIAGVVTKVRMDNWAERAVYRANMVDAGYVMLPDGTFVKDAGVAVVLPVDAGVVVEAVDAGEPSTPDAAVAVAPTAPVDAGVVTAPARPLVEVEAKQAPPTEEEEALLATLEQVHRSADWDRLAELRAKVFNELKTPAASARGVALVLEGVCQRHDLVVVRSVIPRVRALGPTQARKVRERCVALYPDAAGLDW